MSKILEHTHRIYNNSFVFTPLIIEFYKGYKGQDKDILLAYLILPLVLHEETMQWLSKAKTTSSLHSFGRIKENYFGLPQRIVEYKNITNKCLQNAIDNKRIAIDEDLRVNIIDSSNIDVPLSEKSLKASANIVKIIKDLGVVPIYRLLGVKKL